MSPLKAALQEIVQGLVRNGRASAEEAAGFLRLPVPALSRRLSELLRGCVVVLDRLEQATPAMAPALEAITAEATTVGITTELPTSTKLTRFWWRFQKRVQLQPLSPEASKQLFWSRVRPETVPHPKAWDRAVLTKGGGSPMAILALAEQAKILPEPEAAEHPAGRREIDLTPGLLLLGAGVIAARFIALGLDDTDTYVLAGIGGAFFVVARYFIYRLLRQRSSR